MGKQVNNVSRRRFLRNTGALVVTFSLAGALPPLVGAQAQPAPPPTVPINLDGWLKIQGDGGIRDGAWVADITETLDLSAWPTGAKVIVRAERPVPCHNSTLVR